MRRLLAAAPLSALLVAFLPSPASAATYSSSGLRCTKVGTSGADRLYGTSSRDVLCGLGGNDVLYGYGGDDVLDGGSGADSLYGSSGIDRLYGGTGNDRLLGESGNDTVFGDGGADQVSGGTGNDVLAGKDGADTIYGGTGADKEYGGIGDDTIRGGDDGDLLAGQDGNDDLSGENGTDALDGGAGTNWCTVGATDTQKACVYDKTPPAVWWSSVTPNPVNVTYADQQINVRVHVLDDTGVASVQFGLQDFTTGALGPRVGVPTLISGTARDGIWQAYGVAGRYSEPGDFELNVFARDRVGRQTNRTIDAAIRVQDATPDRADAVVAGVTLNKTSVDVRTANGTITTVAHIKDDASGVELGDALVCLYSPGGDGSYVQHACDNLERYSGTARDGYWRFTSTIPKGSVGGDWNIGVWVNDRVHEGTPRYYVGEDVYRYYLQQWGSTDNRLYQLAHARFSVLGTTDNTAAWLAGGSVDKTSVDTLPSSQTITLDLHARDAAGEGVTEIGTSWVPEGGQSDGTPGFPPIDGVRVSGTVTDGIWRAALTMPQGTPPGRYCLAQVWVVDKSHWRSYAPPCSPYVAEQGQLAAPALTGPGGSPWDGWVTVVQNPAG